MTTARSRRATVGHNAIKRIFDLIVSVFALLLLSPIMLAVAILVRVKLGSPVIFRQERPGLHGKPFTIYKFRSMLDTTNANGELLEEADRTPPFGTRLRALSLDELPELWNVVKGDMSLVGPRPLMMVYLTRYTPEQNRRHLVRPGITGLAQVSGRNALSWEEKFAYDIEYVDNHDLRMDIAILARTVSIVLSRKGVRHGEDTNMPPFRGTGDPGSGSA